MHVAFARNLISYLSRHPRLKGHSIQTGHPLYAEDIECPSTTNNMRATCVSMHARMHICVRNNRATGSYESDYMQTNTHIYMMHSHNSSGRPGTHTCAFMLSIRARECAHNSRTRRRMLSFDAFFSLVFFSSRRHSANLTRTDYEI